MRVGVLSDLHCELRPAGSRWLNPFATERLDELADAALAWFAAERVDLVLVLGDVVQIPDLDDLEHMLSRLAAAGVAPVATVNGNHDVRLGAEFGARARRHGIRLLYEEPLTIDGVDVAGVEIDRGPRLPQYVGRAGRSGEEGSILLVASHFPVLSEASRVAGGGIPYAGDIVNRAELEAGLRAAGAADGRAQRPHPRPLLDGRRHAAPVHRRRADRVPLRRHDRRARPGRARGPPDVAPARRACTVRPGPRRRRGAPALGRTVARGRL